MPNPEVEATLAALKNAPPRAKQVAGAAALFGFILLLRFCASAFAGHSTWTRALLSGLFQFFIFWMTGLGVQDRRRFAWWALLVLILLHLWGSLGHSLRLLRVTLEGTLAAHGRETIFDAVGVVQLIMTSILLWLLFSKEVRDYIKSRTVAPTLQPPPRV